MFRFIGAAFCLLCFTATTHAKFDYKINGFASIVAGIKDTTETCYLLADTTRVYSNDVTLDADTRAGLQGSVSLNEQLSATAQVTALAYNDYNPNLEWAFVSYKPSERFLLRAGRLRYPLFMYSDFIDVGYAYPWVTPPAEVYRLPFDNLDALDLIYYYSRQKIDHKFRIFYGEIRDQDVHTYDQEEVDVAIKDNLGVTWEATYKHWTSKLSFTRAVIDLSPTTSGALLASLLSPALADKVLTRNKDIHFFSAGVKYDDKTYFGITELTYAKTFDSILPIERRGYLTIGKKIKSDISIYTGLAIADDERRDYHQQAGNFSGDVLAAEEAGVVKRTTVSLGSRWDFYPNFALKAEANKLFVDNGKNLLLVRLAVDAAF